MGGKHVYRLATDALAENVNAAVESSFLLSFLESVSGLAERLKEPRADKRPFKEVVAEAEKATVLVLVYWALLPPPPFVSSDNLTQT